MQHWNLLYLNCLGFFSDPGYLLLSLLPVPCLEKGRFGRSVCGDRRKEPSPGRAYRSQFEEKRQRTFRPYRFTGFAERNVCLGRAAVESCWRQEHDRSSFIRGNTKSKTNYTYDIDIQQIKEDRKKYEKSQCFPFASHFGLKRG